MDKIRVWMSNTINPDGRMYYPGDSIEIGVGNMDREQTLIFNQHGDAFSIDAIPVDFKTTISRARISNNDIAIMLSVGRIDKKGKLVYDKDIVNVKLLGLTNTEINFFDFKWLSNNLWLLNVKCEIEVIGNSFENPELLK